MTRLCQVNYTPIFGVTNALRIFQQMLKCLSLDTSGSDTLEYLLAPVDGSIRNRWIGGFWGVHGLIVDP